jgi:hypothetical protein
LTDAPDSILLEAENFFHRLRLSWCWRNAREVTVSSRADRLSRALPVLLVVAFMSPPVPAAAWAAPPNLDGESFSGSATLDTSGCSIFGGGTFGFDVSGSATGTYPGPFSESGSVTSSGGTATGFTASFTITATSGTQSGDTIVGVKMLASPAGTGLCLPGEGIAANVHSTYSAVITLISGERFCDTGTATTSISVGLPGTFAESFTSTTPTRAIGATGTCP